MINKVRCIGLFSHKLVMCTVLRPGFSTIEDGQVYNYVIHSMKYNSRVQMLVPSCQIDLLK